MQRFTQRAVMLFTLLSLPSAVLAGTTYNIQNYSYPGDSNRPERVDLDRHDHHGRQTGLHHGRRHHVVDVDGNHGREQNHKHVNWNRGRDGVWFDYGVLDGHHHRTPIRHGRIRPIRGPTFSRGGFGLGWQYNIGLGEWATLYSCDSAENPYYPWNIYTGPNVGMPPPWIIASVPEPSTLYLLGFGAVCGSVYVMRHKRRERRTATTA